jgi:hypothetical protein
MITILLTIDIDADSFDSSFGDNLVSFENQWLGFEIGVPLLLDNIFHLKDTFGNSLVATWFIRADDQIKYYFGEYNYLINSKRSLWQSLINLGHEIGWHPHLYELNDNMWIQSTNEDNLRNQLVNSYTSFNKNSLNKVTSSRIGEAYFSNTISKTLENLRIKYDSTALPGRNRVDRQRSFDWLKTKNIPYKPSKTDYSISNCENFNFLEIPFTMVSSLADYDISPLKRYLDLSFKHSCIKSGISEIVTDGNYLNIIIHPSTIIPEINKGKNHGILSFDIKEVEKNLKYILELAEKRGIEVEFSTVSKFGSKF